MRTRLTQLCALAAVHPLPHRLSPRPPSSLVVAPSNESSLSSWPAALVLAARKACTAPRPPPRIPSTSRSTCLTPTQCPSPSATTTTIPNISTATTATATHMAPTAATAMKTDTTRSAAAMIIVSLRPSCPFVLLLLTFHHSPGYRLGPRCLRPEVRALAGVPGPAAHGHLRVLNTNIHRPQRRQRPRAVSGLECRAADPSVQGGD